MYSSLMLSELVEARYAARLAEAERHRRIRALTAGNTRRLGVKVHLPRPRRHPATACATGR